MVWTDILVDLVCPSLGCLMSAAMYAAPVKDLQRALVKGNLESLNPVPWAIMSGNCLGWCAYGYYIRDPFMLAANIPGLVTSMWLNLGAAKLQYYNCIRESMANTEVGAEEEGIAATDHHDDGKLLLLLFVPQETLVLRIIIAWIVVLLIVGWSGWIQYPATAIGILVNVNLIFFYGAPLQTIQTVLRTKSSDSIHRPTVFTNSVNSLFWLLYGCLARHDPVIYGPNTIGIALGTIQAFLMCCYPQEGEEEGLLTINNSTSGDLQEPLLLPTDDTNDALSASEEVGQIDV